MLRYLVLVASALLLIAFVGLFGYGTLYAVPGSTLARMGIVGSLVAGYAGIGMYFWWQKLDYAHSLRRFSYR